MSNIQAAIGCAQISRVSELRKKREVFPPTAALGALPLTTNIEQEGCVNYWMPTIIVDPGLPFRRDVFIKKLEAANVDARVFFWPLSTIIEYAFDSARLKIADSVHACGLNLPSGFDITEEQIHLITGPISQHITSLKVITVCQHTVAEVGLRRWASSVI